jgi:hypothetical protein
MVDYLRKRFHIRIYFYLADFLILNQSRAGLERDIEIVLRELRRFGWLVSEETKCTTFRVVFNTVSDLVWLPTDRVQLNGNLVSSALNRRS